MASREILHFFSRWKLNTESLKKLRTTLLYINAVLNDAEEKVKNPAVKEWVNELKDTAYHAQDLLDEITTVASRYKLEAELEMCRSKVRSLNLTSLSFSYQGIEPKLEKILGRLEFLAKERDILGLKEGGGEKPSRKWPTTSLVEESSVYGRDDDKDAIIKLLLSNDRSGDSISVIPIVGMGGVGKTTLAQLVYNKKLVTDVFEVSMVSSTGDSDNLDLLQVRLNKSLMGRKFLIVLDDVWSENYEDWSLMSVLKSGAHGSRVIVTTRHKSVALTVRKGTVQPYHLMQLTDEDCWLLFAKHAFGNIDSQEYPELELNGKEVVKKSNGLPLAAKTLAGLLRVNFDPKEWIKILESNRWNFSDGESSILPALRLSYHYLPSYLKPCFAYFSIFPKNFKFKMDELMLLWLVEDFLLSPKTENLEEVGSGYFNELVSRSFLQQSSNIRYVMHDLLHDLAKFISREFCFRMEGNNSYGLSEKTRYFSYSRRKCDAYEGFEALHKAKGTLSVLKLENVVNTRDALETNLRDKLQLEELVLKWGGQTDDFKNDREVLDQLQPHAYLKRLKIENYGGTAFSDWGLFFTWGLRRLHFLLHHRAGPETIDTEFYGTAAFGKEPLESLEILRFKNMLQLKEWAPFADVNGGAAILIISFMRERFRLTPDCLSAYIPKSWVDLEDWGSSVFKRNALRVIITKLAYAAAEKCRSPRRAG
ncbi:putative disease resistance RPP13-like protein 1 [Quercus lobata]|uniref:putative disease resistance RPP13-like protein 1 n=1 Tax=Quercus lobata TaxID=97700 RepID=UPI001244C97E|nr:putative disease resistance RPP13-like protein 1 [Quercus lobata]